MSEDCALAWAAGLFDGEGSVYLRNVGRYPRRGAMLTLEMTDRPTVERFALVVEYGQLWDGSRILKGNLPLWRWRASSQADVLGVSDLLLPYLITKQDAVYAARGSCLSGMAHTQ